MADNAPAPGLPPLVAPAPDLTPAETARYSRQVILPELGPTGQRRLKNARVLVIGAGGLGSPALLYLAAAGVGTIGIVEFDVVEESNLQRQIIHGQSDIGRPKAHSAREAMLEANPLIDVRLHEFRLAPENAVALFSEYDVIVDGTDNFATRYLVNDAAVLAGKPYVWGSIQRFAGQVSVFWEDAPGGRGLNYRDLYPDPPPPGLVPSCAEGGVLGVLCASIAAVMGTEAIKLIAGIGESLLGRLLIYDALAMTWRTVRVRKDPAAPPITALLDGPDYEALCGVTVEDTAVDALTPVEVRVLLESDPRYLLVDVREPVEWEIGHIEGAVLVPKSSIDAGDGLTLLPRDRIPLLYCKTGVRSAAALRTVQQAGHPDARHLLGGITAWAERFEPDLAEY